jgi:hypothetical protein
MANEVYANGRELACKAGAGKTISAFPDVCFTPPENPATPPGVPVPYPNTGFASNTTEGSKNVKISGKEIMLKNNSYFKTSVGDDAGCAAKKGVISSEDKGKVYFTAWSMDVKFEGENVDRHLDLTTDNHAAAQPGNTPPWPFSDSMVIDASGNSDDPCTKDKKKEEEACKDFSPKGSRDACTEAGLGGSKMMSHSEAKDKGHTDLKAWKKSISQAAEANNDAAKCIRARRCKLVPYKPDGCCPAQTADHVIPKASFYKGAADVGNELSNWKNYKPQDAPCMCAEGTGNIGGSHGLRHSVHKLKGKQAGLSKGKKVPFKDELKRSAASSREVFKSSECDEKCIQAQLEKGHEGMGGGEVNHAPCGSDMTQPEINQQMTDFSSAPGTR